MTDLKRPLSLQLNPTRTIQTNNIKTPISGSIPVRPTSILSPCTAKKQAVERPRQLKNSASSGSLASSTWSTNSSSSSSSSSSTSAFSPKTPSPTQANNCGATTESLDSPSLILPYLYVGDQAQTQIDTISSLNISYILSLQSLPKFLDSDIQLEQNDELLTNCDNINHQSNSNSSITHKTQRQVVKRVLSTLNDDDEEENEYGRDEPDGVRQQLGSCTESSVADITNTNIPFIPVVTKVVKNNKEASGDGQQPQAGTSNGLGGGGGDSSSCRIDTDCDPCDKGVAKDLLPSMNSSKDYLVKFRSCVDRLIKGKCINISDTFEQLVDKFFDETHNFIEEARRNRCNILVHCKAGISRSPTIAIAYLMKWKRLHLQDAYDFVKRCRPQISPNLNFMGQLMNYERRLLQRRFQKCPLPSPTTFCLSSRPYHEQLVAPPSPTTPSPTSSQRPDACIALLNQSMTTTTTNNTSTADNTHKNQDLNAPDTSASEMESFPMSDETVHFTR